VEQYDLDVVDDEAPCDALQRMTIRDVMPQDPSEHQTSQATNDTTPPTQDLEQDQEDEHEDEKEEPQDEGQVHNQEESIDQEENEDDGDHERSRTRLPHPRVRQTIQRDHPMDNILGDVKKGATTRSCVATFCQHYSFVSYLEHVKVEDAL
jgi:hypothetical protein